MTSPRRRLLPTIIGNALTSENIGIGTLTPIKLIVARFTAQTLYTTDAFIIRAICIVFLILKNTRRHRTVPFGLLWIKKKKLLAFYHC